MNPHTLTNLSDATKQTMRALEAAHAALAAASAHAADALDSPLSDIKVTMVRHVVTGWGETLVIDYADEGYASWRLSEADLRDILGREPGDVEDDISELYDAFSLTHVRHGALVSTTSPVPLDARTWRGDFRLIVAEA